MIAASERKTGRGLPEVLAPVGSVAAFLAAMEEGADAVYVGAPGYNARALAREVRLAELVAMIEEAHRRRRRLYVAMNTLVKEDELAPALELVATLAEHRPDALIVQDYGLAGLIRRHFPTMEIHASTLMAVHNGPAVNHLASKGFARVVLARELHLAEIASIAATSPVDLEIFIHGAMCFSYSGLCLFSSLHGGKSSLRGQCVQPCRRRYAWQGKGGRRGRGKGAARDAGYLFSMNDLSGIELLDRLCEIPVRSLKIEGRLKSSEYVRRTVAAYRMVLDSLDEPEGQRRRVLQRAQALLDRSMGRRRSTGFFLSGQEDRLIQPTASGTTGQEIGAVQRIEPTGREQAILTVRLRTLVNVGDRLRLVNESRDERWSMSLTTMYLSGRRVQRAEQGKVVTISVPWSKARNQRVKPGDMRVVRVDRDDSRQQERRAVLATTTPIRPVSRERIVSILARLGHSAPGPVKSRKGKAGRGPDGRQRLWWVRGSSLQIVRAKLPVRPARWVVDLSEANLRQLARMGSSLRRQQAQIIWALPSIIHPDRLTWYQEAMVHLLSEGFTAFQLAQLSQGGLLPGGGSAAQSEIRLYGDYTVNILNSAGLDAAGQEGLHAVLFSLETDQGNLQQALTHYARAKEQGAGAMKTGLVVYGRPPLFTARHAASHFQYGPEVHSSRGEGFVLQQSDQVIQVRAVKPFSLLDQLKVIEQAGIDFLVLDLSGGPLQQEIAQVASLLHNGADDPDRLEGNFRAGLR